MIKPNDTDNLIRSYILPIQKDLDKHINKQKVAE